tara:strand:+ start:262 stop:468 length:207 start_codon:yes stop_codon:yes gene_type:complete
MKIFKTFKDKENWFETTEEEMVAKTQNIYPDPIQVIKDNGTIQNSWAIWKLKPQTTFEKNLELYKDFI